MTLPVTVTSFGALLPHPTMAKETANSPRAIKSRMACTSIEGDDLAVGRTDHESDHRWWGAITNCPHATVAEDELWPSRGRRTPVATAAAFVPDRPAWTRCEFRLRVQLGI